MYKRTPFRDRAIDMMKSKEPQSTMSTDGENGGGPKKRKSVRGLTTKVEGKTTRRSNEPKEDFEMYIEEGGATRVRPENQVPITTKQGLRAKIESIDKGGATGFTYDDQGNVLTGKALRQYKKQKKSEARQEFRRNR